MNVNQDFLPDKFKKFNLAKNNTNDENDLISNDIKMELEYEPSHPVEEDEKKPSKKKEIVSSSDFLEQQRQLKKPESSVVTENKKRTTEQLNSNDVLYSTVYQKFIYRELQVVKSIIAITMKILLFLEVFLK